MPDVAASTPFPSRPRLHSASPPRSTPDDRTPRELRALEAAWRSLRRRSGPLLPPLPAEKHTGTQPTEELSVKAAGWRDAAAAGATRLAAAGPSTRPPATRLVATSDDKENAPLRPTSHLAKAVVGSSRSRRRLPSPVRESLVALTGSKGGTSRSTNVPLAQQQQTLLYPSARLPSAGIASVTYSNVPDSALRLASHASSAGTCKAAGSPPCMATRPHHDARRHAHDVTNDAVSPDDSRSPKTAYGYSWEANTTKASPSAQPAASKQPRSSTARRPARRSPSRRLAEPSRPGNQDAVNRIVSTGSSTAPLHVAREPLPPWSGARDQSDAHVQHRKADVDRRRPSPHVVFAESFALDKSPVDRRTRSDRTQKEQSTVVRHQAEHPLSTVHLAPAAQALKHGHVVLLGGPPGAARNQGVVLWLRNDLWAVSADGRMLAYWPSITPKSSRTVPNRRPSASWLLPTDLSEAGRIVDREGEKHGRRLRFLAGWIAAERARAVIATVNLPPPTYPQGTTLIIHGDGPSPSLTLHLSNSTASTTTKARWVSFSPDSITLENRSAALWTKRIVRRGPPDPSSGAGDDAQTAETAVGAVSLEERLAWGLLERCLQDRVGEGIWRAVVGGDAGRDIEHRPGR